jgi:hypothetical protein
MPDVPYTDDQLAKILYVPLDIFKRVIASIPADMVTRDLHQCLVVMNWSNYQTEYERQKGYRTKLHPRVTPQKSEVRSQKSEEQKEKSERNLASASPNADGVKSKEPKFRSPAQQAYDIPMQTFADAYKLVYGKDYVFTSGRDHKVIQQLMGKVDPVAFAEEFKTRVNLAVARHTPGDKWNEYPTDLSLFKARWNKLVDPNRPCESLNDRLRRQGEI